MRYLILFITLALTLNRANSQSITILPDSTRASNFRGIAWISPLKVSDIPNAVLPTPTLPVQGEGTRFMWIPSRSAFRAGTIENRGGNEQTFWDASNVGLYSFTAGYNTLANGRLGVAFGHSTKAQGHNSTALGYLSLAGGAYSLATGIATSANGNASTTMGFYTTTPSFATLTIGRWNSNFNGLPNLSDWVATDPLFIAGNGISFQQPSHALVLYKNGNLTIAGSLTQNSDLRLKKDIVTLENVSSKLMQLRGVRYQFDLSKRPSLPDGLQIGLVAQEVEALFPELVFTDAEGFKSVDYARLTPILLQAFKELAMRVQKLEMKIK